MVPVSLGDERRAGQVYIACELGSGGTDMRTAAFCVLTPIHYLFNWIGMGKGEAEHDAEVNLASKRAEAAAVAQGFKLSRKALLQM